MGKTSNYRLRVEPDLHQEFLDVCKSESKPAAQVIREFMRDYVKKNRAGQQLDLFIAEEPQRYKNGEK